MSGYLALDFYFWTPQYNLPVDFGQDFSAEQSYLQPPAQQTDIVHVIRGVIEAESGAIDFYNQIVEATEGVDPVTNDMVIAILRDEDTERGGFGHFAGRNRGRRRRNQLFVKRRVALNLDDLA